MIKNATLLVLLVLTATFFSCTDKASKYLALGKQNYDREQFEPAAEDLKQALSYGEDKPSSFKADANFHIAESYRKSNRIHEAEEYYKLAIKQGYVDEHADFFLAYAMKSNGKYESAKAQLRRYLKIGTNFEYISRAKHELKNLEELSEIARHRPEYKVRNCKEMNTDAIEYSPMKIGNNFYISSSRGEGIVYEGQGTRFTDIYEYRFDGATEFSGQAIPLNVLINDPKRHEATTTFTPDGLTMIFSRSNNGKKNDITQEVDLFESKLVNGDWSEPKRLAISQTHSWDSNPFLSADGKTLYFASNREGGRGGDDIWKSTRDESGEWGNVKNLGGKINTPSDEQFPYLDTHGNFYFASDGHPGFGELDIFVYRKGDDGKRHVENMGTPINSSHDDFGLIFTDDEKGYFASNRPDGLGDDDIYYFVHEYEIKYFLEGYVKGRTIDKDNHISDKTVMLSDALVVMKDHQQETDVVMGSATTTDSAYYKFEVKPEMVYDLHGEHQGYLARDIEFSTVGKTAPKNQREDVFFRADLILDPIAENLVIEFDPIYYPYNSWEITPAAEVVLLEMVDVLEKNPSILVELGSHTDARGSANFNKKLSQNRAEAAVEWILTHGIPKERLTAKGYGEQTPLTVRKDTAMYKKGTYLTHVYLDSLEKTGDTTSSEFGHQLNRRTEFKIVGQIKEDLDVNAIEVIDSGKEEEIIEQKKLDNEEEIIDRYLQKEDVVIPDSVRMKSEGHSPDE